VFVLAWPGSELLLSVDVLRWEYEKFKDVIYIDTNGELSDEGAAKGGGKQWQLAEATGTHADPALPAVYLAVCRRRHPLEWDQEPRLV
jgi:hypothetical protein